MANQQGIITKADVKLLKSSVTDMIGELGRLNKQLEESGKQASTFASVLGDKKEFSAFLKNIQAIDATSARAFGNIAQGIKRIVDASEKASKTGLDEGVFSAMVSRFDPSGIETLERNVESFREPIAAISNVIDDIFKSGDILELRNSISYILNVFKSVEDISKSVSSAASAASASGLNLNPLREVLSFTNKELIPALKDISAVTGAGSSTELVSRIDGLVHYANGLSILSSSAKDVNLAHVRTVAEATNVLTGLGPIVGADLESITKAFKDFVAIGSLSRSTEDVQAFAKSSAELVDAIGSFRAVNVDQLVIFVGSMESILKAVNEKLSQFAVSDALRGSINSLSTFIKAVKQIGVDVESAVDGEAYDAFGDGLSRVGLAVEKIAEVFNYINGVDESGMARVRAFGENVRPSLNAISEAFRSYISIVKTVPNLPTGDDRNPIITFINSYEILAKSVVSAFSNADGEIAIDPSQAASIAKVVNAMSGIARALSSTSIDGESIEKIKSLDIAQVIEGTIAQARRITDGDEAFSDVDKFDAMIESVDKAERDFALAGKRTVEFLDNVVENVKATKDKVASAAAVVREHSAAVGESVAEFGKSIGLTEDHFELFKLTGQLVASMPGDFAKAVAIKDGAAADELTQSAELLFELLTDSVGALPKYALATSAEMLKSVGITQDRIASVRTGFSKLSQDLKTLSGIPGVAIQAAQTRDKETMNALGESLRSSLAIFAKHGQSVYGALKGATKWLILFAAPGIAKLVFNGVRGFIQIGKAASEFFKKSGDLGGSKSSAVNQADSVKDFVNLSDAIKVMNSDFQDTKHLESAKKFISEVMKMFNTISHEVKASSAMKETLKALSEVSNTISHLVKQVAKVAQSTRDIDGVDAIGSSVKKLVQSLQHLIGPDGLTKQIGDANLGKRDFKGVIKRLLGIGELEQVFRVIARVVKKIGRSSKGIENIGDFGKVGSAINNITSSVKRIMAVQKDLPDIEGFSRVERVFRGMGKVFEKSEIDKAITIIARSVRKLGKIKLPRDANVDVLTSIGRMAEGLTKFTKLISDEKIDTKKANKFASGLAPLINTLSKLKSVDLSGLGSSIDAIGKLSSIGSLGKIDLQKVKLKGIDNLAKEIQKAAKQISKKVDPADIQMLNDSVVALSRLNGKTGVGTVKKAVGDTVSTFGELVKKSLIDSTVDVAVKAVVSNIGNMFNQLQGWDKKLVDVIRETGEQIRDISEGVLDFGNRMIEQAGIQNVFRSTGMEMAKEFDQISSQVKVFGGIQGEALVQAEALADQIGINYPLSANEALAAILELSKAGQSLPNIRNILPTASDLASLAENMDVDAASQFIIAVEGAFETLDGEVAATFENSARAADIVAVAANSSTATIDDLTDAIVKVGPVASNANTSLEEVAAASALLDRAGLKGNEGGNKLIAIMSQLSRPQAREELERLGVAFSNADGSRRSLNEILTDVSAAYKVLGLSQTEAGDSMSKLVESQTQSALAVLLSNDGLDAQIAIMDELAAGGGAAERARELTNNFAGDLEQLGGSWETLQKNVFRPMIERFFRPVVKLARFLVDGFLNADKAFHEFLGTGVLLGSVIATVVGGLLSAVGAVGIFGGIMLKTIATIASLGAPTIIGGLGLFVTSLVTMAGIAAAATFAIAALSSTVNGMYRAFESNAEGLDANGNLVRTKDKFNELKSAIEGMVASGTRLLGDFSLAFRAVFSEMFGIFENDSASQVVRLFDGVEDAVAGIKSKIDEISLGDLVEQILLFKIYAERTLHAVGNIAQGYLGSLNEIDGSNRRMILGVAELGLVASEAFQSFTGIDMGNEIELFSVGDIETAAKSIVSRIFDAMRVAVLDNQDAIRSIVTMAINYASPAMNIAHVARMLGLENLAKAVEWAYATVKETAQKLLTVLFSALEGKGVGEAILEEFSWANEVAQLIGSIAAFIKTIISAIDEFGAKLLQAGATFAQNQIFNLTGTEDWESAIGRMSGMLTEFTDYMTGPFATAAGGVISSTIEFIVNVFNSAVHHIGNAVNAIKGYAAGIAEAFEEGGFVNAISYALSGIVNGITGLLKAFSETNFMKGIGNFIHNIGGGILDGTVDSLAKGDLTVGIISLILAAFSPKAIRGYGAIIEGLFETVLQTLEKSKVFAGFGATLRGFVSPFRFAISFVIEIAAQLSEAIVNLWNLFKWRVRMVGLAGKMMLAGLRAIWTGIVNMFLSAPTIIANALKSFWRFLSNVDFLKPIIRLLEPIIGLLEPIIGLLERLSTKIRSVFDGVVNFFKNIGQSLSRFAEMAGGATRTMNIMSGQIAGVVTAGLLLIKVFGVKGLIGVLTTFGPPLILAAAALIAFNSVAKNTSSFIEGDFIGGIMGSLKDFSVTVAGLLGFNDEAISILEENFRMAEIIIRHYSSKWVDSALDGFWKANRVAIQARSIGHSGSAEALKAQNDSKLFTGIEYFKNIQDQYDRIADEFDEDSAVNFANAMKVEKEKILDEFVNLYASVGGDFSKVDPVDMDALIAALELTGQLSSVKDILGDDPLGYITYFEALAQNAIMTEDAVNGAVGGLQGLVLAQGTDTEGITEAFAQLDQTQREQTIEAIESARATDIENGGHMSGYFESYLIAFRALNEEIERDLASGPASSDDADNLNNAAQAAENYAAGLEHVNEATAAGSSADVADASVEVDTNFPQLENSMEYLNEQMGGVMESLGILQAEDVEIDLEIDSSAVDDLDTTLSGVNSQLDEELAEQYRQSNEERAKAIEKLADFEVESQKSKQKEEKRESEASEKIKDAQDDYIKDVAKADEDYRNKQIEAQEAYAKRVKEINARANEDISKELQDASINRDAAAAQAARERVEEAKAAAEEERKTATEERDKQLEDLKTDRDRRIVDLTERRKERIAEAEANLADIRSEHAIARGEREKELAELKASAGEGAAIVADSERAKLEVEADAAQARVQLNQEAAQAIVNVIAKAREMVNGQYSGLLSTIANATKQLMNSSGYGNFGRGIRDFFGGGSSGFEVADKGSSRGARNIPEFDTGGYVRKEGLAYLHKDEEVLNRDATRQLMTMNMKTPSAQNHSVVVDMSGMVIQSSPGMSEDVLARKIEERVVTGVIQAVRRSRSNS